MVEETIKTIKETEMQAEAMVKKAEEAGIRDKVKIMVAALKESAGAKESEVISAVISALV